MSVFRSNIFRRGLILLASVCIVVLAGVSTAFAQSPWWHLVSFSRPAYIQPGHTGELVLYATNLGDATLNAEGTPVTIKDVLPRGFKVVGMGGSYGELQGYQGGVGDDNEKGEEILNPSCSEVSVSCTWTGLVPPFEQLEIRVRVMVEPGPESGEVNEFNVSGGDALPATVRRPVTVSEAPVPFGVNQYEFDPEEEGGRTDTQAGSHPFQLTSTIMLNENSEGEPIALTKDLHFKLPAGFFGNPSPFKLCALQQFLALHEGIYNDCPLGSVVGVAKVWVHFTESSFSLLPSVAVSTPVYILVPAYGEPARFGFQIDPGVPVFLGTAVRTGGDYGVTVNVSNISQAVGFQGSQVTLWGVPGDPRHDNVRGEGCFWENHLFDGEIPLGGVGCAPLGQPFPPPLLSLPTSCTGPLPTSVEADSWKQPGVFGSALTVEPLAAQDGCNRLPFSPSLSVAPDGQAGSTPTGLTVGIHVPQTVDLAGGGLAEATVRNTTVTLPEGVTLAAGAADGLEACSQEEIGLETAAFPTCPDASKVATVTITTPLLPNPLEGEVYLADQDANPFGSLVALYLVARDPVSGVLIKVAGKVVLNPVSGQLVATFENTPNLPFEGLSMHFFGGARAPLATPASCGTYTTTSSIEGWAGNPPSSPSSSFEIVSGPNGEPCASPLPFAPSLAAGTTSIQAGGYTPFTMTMSREDGNQNLEAVQLRMPEGLAGTLSTVKLCGEPQADAGTCGPESLIGHTTVSVGLGGDPYTVTGGQVFITGPYEGAPFGISVVVPAKAGPYNFGTVVVRGKIEVNPTTSALTITTDTMGPYKIPTILEGIPLEIKHVNVTIDRPGFVFNPTNCSPLQITGSLTSTEGASDSLAVPFQVTNCAVLAFKPKLEASTSGKASRASGASLTVKLGYPAGPYDANIAKVKVELPKQLPSRLTTLQKACKAVVFEANPAGCPAASIVGHATAVTPLLPVPLTGPAYFVSHGGEAFPSLVIVLQGYGVTVDLVGSTFINKAGITSSTFKTVPDAPVGTFELTLPQGPYSALAANADLCKTKSLTMPTEFIGQNGALIKTTTKIAVTGCAKAKHKAKKASKRHKGKRRAKGKGKKK